MQVRPIEAHEIEAFVRVSTGDAHLESVHSYLTQLVAKDSARAAWCYVAEADGQWLGRIAFWKLPKTGKPSDIILLDLDWEREDVFVIGKELLEAVFAIARGLNVQKIGHVLDSPPAAPQWQFFPEQRTRLLESVGFQLERETLRFELNMADRPAVFPTDLIFRGLPEVGEAAFIDALMQVSAHSLDQRVQHDRVEMGIEGEARMTFEDLAEMDYDPAWWQLAYTQSGDLVGLVMPTKNPTFATIGYIGVVPEQRGHGYIHRLLQQGTATLNAAGETTMRNDTDVSNAPMANAFLRAGHQQFATRREYSVKL